MSQSRFMGTLHSMRLLYNTSLLTEAYDNYYSRLSRPSCKLVQQQNISPNLTILPYSKQNGWVHGSQIVMFSLLFESLLPEFVQYLPTYTLSIS
jgi:hypothetical protein